MKFRLPLFLIFIALFGKGYPMEKVPNFLYKILTCENWEKSQNEKNVVLSKEDADFIHFSKEDQVERITAKYWSDVPEYVILKIDTAELPGRLVYEPNPGGSSKYYHLYDGYIPKKSIVDIEVVKSKVSVNS